MNSVYQDLNKNNMMAQFEQFKKTFTGNPKEEVQKLLDSGQMSQQDFEKYSQMATQLQSLLGGRM